MIPGGRALVVLAALAVLAGACAAPAPGGSPPVRTPHVEVPAMPLPPVRSLHVDPSLLEAAACVECEREDGGDRDRFFSGRLALASFDSLVDDPGGDRRDGYAGNLLVSGYFGGIQLRGTLGGIGARDAGPAAPLLDLLGRSTLAGLDQQVARLLRIAATGTDAAVGAEAGELLPALALLYGYNLGYLQVALEHPPRGVADPGDRVECPTSLSCRAPSLQMASAGRYDTTFARLASPPDARWAWTSGISTFLVDAAVPGGRAVWSRLLAGGGFDPAGYEAIVDLSGGFLQVAGLALAGAAAASAGGDLDLARRSLALTAGLIAWAGSYFLELASPLPDDSLPRLDCDVASG